MKRLLQVGPPTSGLPSRSSVPSAEDNLIGAASLPAMDVRDS
jgi:hypothetical protein